MSRCGGARPTNERSVRKGMESEILIIVHRPQRWPHDSNQDEGNHKAVAQPIACTRIVAVSRHCINY